MIELTTVEAIHITVLLIASAIVVGIIYLILSYGAGDKPLQPMFNFFDRRIYKNNPNQYLYRKIKSCKKSEYVIIDFLDVFIKEYCLHNYIFSDTLHQKEKNICLNGFRYLLGLINLKLIDENRAKSLIPIIFNELWNGQNNQSLSMFLEKNESLCYEKENIIIWNWQLVDTDYEQENKQIVCTIRYFIFKNIKNGNIVKIKLDDIKTLKERTI